MRSATLLGDIPSVGRRAGAADARLIAMMTQAEKSLGARQADGAEIPTRAEVRTGEITPGRLPAKPAANTG